MTEPADWFELSLQDGSLATASAESQSGTDHHALLARKSRDSPVERLAPFGTGSPQAYVVYGYQEAVAVLSDTRRFCLDVVEQRYRTVLGSSFLTAAPQVRRALRRLLRERLRPDEPEVAAMVDGVVRSRMEALSAETSNTGHPDLVEQLATQAPARIMVSLLGLGEQEWQSVAELSAATAGFLRDQRGAVRAARTLRHRFAAAIRDRLASHGDDVISALADTEVDGRRLDEKELISSLLLLAWAGTETTGPAIANCLYALLTHPEVAGAVRTDPELLPAAVNEALRWETPVQVTARRADSAAEIAGMPVPEGAIVLVHLGAANRDARQFQRPHTFDPGRTESPPLTFGYGPHHCLGAALARSQIDHHVRALLDRFPQARLAPEAHAPQGSVLRCPRKLPVLLQMSGRVRAGERKSWDGFS